MLIEPLLDGYSRMVTSSKKFSPELHAENDGPAKEAVLAYIRKRWGKECKEGGKYDVDIQIYEYGQLIGFAEVERRPDWTAEFPFPTVNIPFRKRKFFVLDLPTIMFSVNHNCDHALWCRSDIILDSLVVENKNKYVKANEQFFSVPLRYWKLVCLQS